VGPDDPGIDIALDPLEGTNLCAYGRPGAIAVVALAERGKLLNAPDTYMEKLAVGPEARGAIDMRKSPTDNLRAIARALGRDPGDLTVVILDRPRHEELIREVRTAGARIRLIEDGDVAGGVATCFPETGVDVLMGIGGAPEGVITAAAVKSVGGDMQGRLRTRNDDEIARARRMGIKDLDRIYTAEELAQGEVMFAATGVTSSDFLRGVRFLGGGAETWSVVMRSKTGTTATCRPSTASRRSPSTSPIRREGADHARREPEHRHRHHPGAVVRRHRRLRPLRGVPPRGEGGEELQPSGNEVDVAYGIDLVKRIHYTLHHLEERPRTVRWTFVKGEVMRDNHGSWTLEPRPTGRPAPRTPSRWEWVPWYHGPS
jgi:fructose-1,6-bisphosphatase II